MKKDTNKDIYKYPLLDLDQITDLRDMLNNSEQKYADRTAFLTKDPIALRELEPRSPEALNYQANVNDEYRSISYQQYVDDVRALGSALKKLGITRDDKVCILAETRYEWYISYLAVVNGLATVVPMDKMLPANELFNNLERAQTNTIIYSNSTKENIQELASKIDFVKHYINMDLPQAKSIRNTNNESYEINNDTSFINEENIINSKEELYFWDIIGKGQAIRSEGDLSYDNLDIDPYEFSILLFTSGTTSTSKAVMLSHNNICNCAYNSSRMIDFANTTVLSILPIHHTYEATCDFLIQIYMGNTIAIGDGLRHIAKNAQQSKATMILMVPAILEALYRNIQRKFDKDEKLKKKFQTGMRISSFLNKIGIDIRKKVFKQVHDMFGGKLKYLVVGGAAIDPEIITFFNNLGFATIQGYGLTEASPIFALNREHYSDPASAGLPIPTMEVKIINQDKDGIGEIIGRGPSIMLGYYQDEERTAEAIDAEGFYHTGDFGYLDDRSFLFITGRKANIIVSKGGENVFPEEIEFLLYRHPVIKEVVVFGERSASGEQLIKAEILPDEEYLREKLSENSLTGETSHKELQATIREVNSDLKQYQKIIDYEIRTEPFPRNTSNKILRHRHQDNVGNN